MAIQILMPALSPTMTEGKLGKWLKAEGDKIKSGDIIAEIETDKATMEFEAVDEGTLGKILVPAGAEGVAVNTPIAVLLHDGESKAAASPMPRRPGGSAGPARAACTARPPAARPAAPLATAPEANFRQDHHADGARGVARRHGRGNAPRPQGVPDGRGSRPISGRLQGQPGIAAKSSAPKRVIDTPITEMGFAGLGVGAAYDGLKPIVEFMTFNFAMQAIDQIINSAAKTLYMWRRADALSRSCSAAPTAPPRASAPSTRQCYASLVCPCAGPEGGGALCRPPTPRACSRPRSAIPIRWSSSKMRLLYGQSFEVPDDPDFVVPIGQAKIERAGQRRHHRGLLAHGRPGP